MVEVALDRHVEHAAHRRGAGVEVDQDRRSGACQAEREVHGEGGLADSSLAGGDRYNAAHWRAAYPKRVAGLPPPDVSSMRMRASPADRERRSTRGRRAMKSARTTVGESGDPHSAARPEDVRVEHLALDLTVDFSSRVLRGAATLTLAAHPHGGELRLDTRDLEIAAVHLDGDSAATFRLEPEVKFLGRALSIDVGPATRTVTVAYATRPEAAALQWLTPAHTAGGKLPFVFTLSQSILARTWVPCQDTPSVRFTYEAVLHVPKELMAVMSAGNPTERAADGVYRFRMEQPIPSYLLALAVGDLAFRSVGPRTGVYAEPTLIEKAAWEFADSEKMVTTAESLFGPYRWGRYDLLVLPPSFPYGGMENPRLTFATPTILAGDRSLVSLVAHELAHSWSGNLVTNATWSDFWLNEGFTNYFENRIMEALYGREFSEMQAALQLASLRKTIAEMGPENPDTRLQLELAGRDPDDGVNDIAYEKGFFFVRLLEEQAGRAR